MSGPEPQNPDANTGVTPQAHSAEYFVETRDYWWNEDFLVLIGQRLRFGEVRTVLDVGCGVGHWGRALAAALPAAATLVGIDRETRWVQEAVVNAQRVGLGGRFHYQQGSAERLEFADASFDLVTCQTLLIHVPDPRLVLAEMLRVTKPGGLVLAAEPNNFANVAVLTSLSAGMETAEITETLRLHLLCQRGKAALGLGFISVGDLVPGMLAQLGACDISVQMNEKTSPLFPPYPGRQQQAEIEQFRLWLEREFWLWDKAETLRYFEAGGGATTEFESLWAMVGKQQRAIATAIDAGTFHTAGGGLSYLVSGRRGSEA